MTDFQASPWVYLGIPSLAVMLLLLLIWALAVAECALGAKASSARRRAFAGGALGSMWIALTWSAAASGFLARFDVRPPPLLGLLLLVLVGAVLLARSQVGERLALGLPLWALVGFQSFRLPLELLLHQAARDGILPIEMSFAGYNFDIVSGASALLLGIALLRGRAGARLVLLWNVLGLLLLVNIGVIAVAATPLFHVFGPNHFNTLVSRAPFVLLPSVLVASALLGHLLVFRKLRAEARLNASDKGSADLRRPDTAAAQP